MLVKDVMSINPVFLTPTATVKDAADKMIKLDCGFIPIGDKDRLTGAITDRDIVIRCIASGKDAKTTQLREIMSEHILYCFEGDDVEKAAKIMSDKQVHRLVVLNKDKRMTGIVSLGDITRKSKDTQLCGKTFEAISQK